MSDPTKTDAFAYIRGEHMAQRDRDAGRSPRYTHVGGGGFHTCTPYVHGYLSLVDERRGRWKRGPRTVRTVR